MPHVVSMLRGLNLAAHNRIRMDPLCEVYRSLGLRDVRSCLQSGNVIFESRANLDRIARQVEKSLLDQFGIRTTVIQRTAAEVREAVLQNPFAARAGVDPAKLIVHFLARPPKIHSVLPPTIEEMHFAGREMYVYYPEGQGRSKFPIAAIEKAVGTLGTARNWNTVMKLLELVEGAATRP
jgi:uncharacterized protein (DUF1697 family)